MGKVIGIDLGTTNSCVAIMEGTTPKVIQLENAMGCAISYFAKAQAVVVNRDRFAPVKSNADLLALRSDVYEELPDHRLDARRGRPFRPGCQWQGRLGCRDRGDPNLGRARSTLSGRRRGADFRQPQPGSL